MFDLILDSSFPKSDGCVADSFHAYDNRKKEKKYRNVNSNITVC